MTFEDALYDVNTKMEDRAFGAVKQDITNQGCKTLGETVRLLEIGANTEGMAILKVEVGGKEKCVSTNRKAEYFDGLENRIVYISGLKSLCKKEVGETWYIRSCKDVTDREKSIANSNKLSEEEKEMFQRNIEKFSPEIQRDLGLKKLELVGKQEQVKESEKILYKDPEEYDALYMVLKKVMPQEFRDIYESVRCRLDKNCSASEKKNYLKQMADIMEFNWIRDADYKYIDISYLREKINATHIGHRKQLEEIYTEFEAANISEIMPKTICLIGHPDTGINQLAETIASSIGRGVFSA